MPCFLIKFDKKKEFARIVAIAISEGFPNKDTNEFISLTYSNGLFLYGIVQLTKAGSPQNRGTLS